MANLNVTSGDKVVVVEGWTNLVMAPAIVKKVTKDGYINVTFTAGSNVGESFNYHLDGTPAGRKSWGKLVIPGTEDGVTWETAVEQAEQRELQRQQAIDARIAEEARKAEAKKQKYQQTDERYGDELVANTVELAPGLFQTKVVVDGKPVVMMTTTKPTQYYSSQVHDLVEGLEADVNAWYQTSEGWQTVRVSGRGRNMREQLVNSLMSLCNWMI